MTHVMEEKAALRQAIKERLRDMGPKARATESRSLCRRLLPLLPQGTAVCGYVPLPTEPDIRPVLQAVLDRGDVLYLPAYEGGRVAFRHVQDLAELVPGELQIPEPPISAAPFAIGQEATALVPGRAFDAKGNRLGRGAGGYDQWISAERKQHAKIRYLGIAFECQIVQEIPAEPHDQPVDTVVTARGTLDRT